jgi:hypothetical protein
MTVKLVQSIISATLRIRKTPIGQTTKATSASRASHDWRFFSD